MRKPQSHSALGLFVGLGQERAIGPALRSRGAKRQTKAAKPPQA